MTKLMLDFGGVVIRTPFEMVHKLDPVPSWHGPFNPEADELWQSMQRGDITERGYWLRRAKEFFAGDDPMRDLFRTMLDHPEEQVVRPEMTRFLATVDKPGVITNDLSRFHPPEWIDAITITSIFDPLIDLSHSEFLKPDPRAFAYALSELALPADEVLFVDDQPFNLRGAEAVGMRTEWFDVTDVDGSISRIKKAMDDD